MVPPCEADMIPTILHGKRQAWVLSDAERFHSTNFQNEVKVLGGRPYYARPDFPEETARS